MEVISMRRALCHSKRIRKKEKHIILEHRPDEAFLKIFVHKVCEETNVHPVLQVEEGIEVTSRENENGKFYFVMNHNAAEKQIVLPEGKWENLIGAQPENEKLILKARDVAVLKRR